MTLTVAIDGPAAAGKGTLARRLAAAFAIPYLDTGLLYRAVARKLLDAGADPEDVAAASTAAAALRPADLDRRDLRGPEADRAASLVASIPGVRAALLAFQRDFARNGAVLDGRDIGTIILPDASIKLFITASLAARAGRRWAELSRAGAAPTLGEVEADLRTRDALDMARAASPLFPAPGAEIIDTTLLDADAAFACTRPLVERAALASVARPA